MAWTDGMVCPLPVHTAYMASRTHGHSGDIPVWPEMPTSQSVHHPLPRDSGGFPWRLAPCIKLVSKWHLLLVISVPSADPKLVNLSPWEQRTKVLPLEHLTALTFGESTPPGRTCGSDAADSRADPSELTGFRPLSLLHCLFLQ